MKRQFYILFIWAVILLVLASTAGCRKELCYNHFRALSIGLDWEYEWERDYGRNHSSTWDAAYHGFEYDDLRPTRPEWVNLVRYKDSGPEYETYLSAEGGDVMVDGEEGQSFLLYNGDTEYIILSDMVSAPQARASATSRSRASLEKVMEMYPGSRTTNPPDIIYSAFVEKTPPVGLHELLPLPVNMQPRVYTYTIYYEFEEGIQHIALARGALGGMAESVYLIDGKTSDETAIILYDCTVSGSRCQATVKSFGVPGFTDEYVGQRTGASPEQPFTLNLEVRLTNGEYKEFNFDVSDQLQNQPRGGVIKVSGLRIEAWENQSDSGFNVGVEDWGDRVDIDLPVGV